MSDVRKIIDKEFDMLSFGEVVLRLSPEGNERIKDCEIFKKRIGGSELNVAIGVAALGLKAGIISRIPENQLGEFANKCIRFNGVSDKYLVYDRSKDARIGILFSELGSNPRKPSHCIRWVDDFFHPK